MWAILLLLFCEKCFILYLQATMWLFFCKIYCFCKNCFTNNCENWSQSISILFFLCKIGFQKSRAMIVITTVQLLVKSWFFDVESKKETGKTKKEEQKDNWQMVNNLFKKNLVSNKNIYTSYNYVLAVRDSYNYEI